MTSQLNRPRRADVRLKENETFVTKFSLGEKFVTKFSLGDKKRLLAALRKYHPDDLTEIKAEFLPYRTEKEIEWYIRRLRPKVSLLKKDPETLLRVNAPLEHWLRKAEELTVHAPDHSFALAKVFKTIANDETHDSKVKDTDPDWKLIYEYIVALLRGFEAPAVGQIEAGILLDLTDNLAGFLPTLETTDQRWMMKRKFELLIGSGESTSEDPYAAACRALQDDLIETERNKRVNGTASTSSTTPELSSHPGPSSSTSSSVSTSDPTRNTLSASASQGTPLRSPARNINVYLANGSTPESGGFRRPPGRRSLRPDPMANLICPKQNEPLYSINPFCVPIKYLNPRTRANNYAVKNYLTKKKLRHNSSKSKIGKGAINEKLSAKNTKQGKEPRVKTPRTKKAPRAKKLSSGSLGNTNLSTLSVAQADEMHVEQTEGIQVEPVEGVPVERVEGVPLGSVEWVPLVSIEGMQIEQTEGVPHEPTEGVPLGSAEWVLLEPADQVPLGSAEWVPLEPAEGVPLESIEGVPLEASEGVPLDASKGGPLGSAEWVQVEADAMPPGQTVRGPSGQTEGVPLAVTEGGST